MFAGSVHKAITFNDFLYVKMEPRRSRIELAQPQLTGVNILDEEHPFVEIGGWSSG